MMGTHPMRERVRTYAADVDAVAAATLNMSLRKFCLSTPSVVKQILLINARRQ